MDEFFDNIKEIKLNSYAEFEVPDGLFPEMESSFVRDLPKTAMDMLAGKDIDYINLNFSFIYSTFNKMKHNIENPSPEYKKHLDKYEKAYDERQERIKNSPSPIPSPPSNKKDSKTLTLMFSDPSFFTKEDFWLDENSIYEKVSANAKQYIDYYACFSLYKFLFVLEEAKKIQSNPDEIDDPYYRLGKAISGFYYVNMMLTQADKMSTELHILKQKEDASKTIRKNTAQKGGKQRTAKYDDLKGKVISLYIEKHSGRSNRDAAQKLSIELASEIKTVLSTDDPSLTIAKWIGKYKQNLTTNS